MAKDLTDRRGRSLVIAGPYQPAAVHAMARAMNEALGNVGSTVTYTSPIAASPRMRRASPGAITLRWAAGRAMAGGCFGLTQYHKCIHY